MKTKPFIFIFAFIISSIFIIPGIFAQLGIPNQFWGDVSYNGASAPDGLSVIAKIDGVTVKEVSVLAGRYGYDPLFFVTDPNEGREGKAIVFYVNNIESSSSVFGNGKTTELNLAVNGPTIGGGPSGGSSSGGGGGGGGGSSGGGGGSSSSTTTFLSDSTNKPTQNNIEELNLNNQEDKGKTKPAGITGAVIGFAKSGVGMVSLFFVLMVMIGIGIVVFLRRDSLTK